MMRRRQAKAIGRCLSTGVHHASRPEMVVETECSWSKARSIVHSVTTVGAVRALELTSKYDSMQQSGNISSAAP